MRFCDMPSVLLYSNLNKYNLGSVLVVVGRLLAPEKTEAKNGVVAIRLEDDGPDVIGLRLTCRCCVWCRKLGSPVDDGDVLVPTF